MVQAVVQEMIVTSVAMEHMPIMAQPVEGSVGQPAHRASTIPPAIYAAGIVSIPRKVKASFARTTPTINKI